MTAAITLAGPDNLTSLLSLMERFHTERGLTYDTDHRTAVAAPLLDGSPLGAVWLIGLVRAPLGYVMVTFGWSVQHGGMVGWIAEVFVRPSVRRRGIGKEVLHAVAVSLGQAGLQALHAQLPEGDADAARFCARVGLRESSTMRLLTDPL